MNSKTAKKIKKAVYGDAATHRTATYAVQNRTGKRGGEARIILTPGSLRKKYKDEKAAYKAFARNGRKTNVQTRKAA